MRTRRGPSSSLVPYMRTVKTTFGRATAVQVVWSSRRGSREIEHLGSAHDKAALKAAAQQRIAAGQLELDLGLGGPGPARPLPITSSRMSHLVDALERAYRALGLEEAASEDDVFRPLAVTRIVAPASKFDSLRVLEEARGSRRRRTRRSSAACRPTRRRSGGRACRRPAPRTPGSARPAWSFRTCPPCISRLTRATGSGSRGSPRSGGWSRRSRSIGLLTGQDGFPLMVSALRNNAETKTLMHTGCGLLVWHDDRRLHANRRVPDLLDVKDRHEETSEYGLAAEHQGGHRRDRHPQGVLVVESAERMDLPVGQREDQADQSEPAR